MVIPHRGGLPHSDIHGSTPARGSPWLFAACHVLHRLLVPRHPPNALIALDTKTMSLQKTLSGSHHAQEPSHPLSRADPAPATQQAFYSALLSNALNTNATHRGTILDALPHHDPFRSDNHDGQHRTPHIIPRCRETTELSYAPRAHQNQIYNTKEQTKHGARLSGTDSMTLSHETSWHRGFAPEPHWGLRPQTPIQGFKGPTAFCGSRAAPWPHSQTWRLSDSNR
jgi:hypothetical protein